LTTKNTKYTKAIVKNSGPEDPALDCPLRGLPYSFPLAAVYWSDGIRDTYEIPNFKHQITNKSQIPIFNDQNTKQVWNFEFRSL
jgi:hypothetical protein